MSENWIVTKVLSENIDKQRWLLGFTISSRFHSFHSFSVFFTLCLSRENGKRVGT